jgi:hypothetical protein
MKIKNINIYIKLVSNTLRVAKNQFVPHFLVYKEFLIFTFGQPANNSKKNPNHHHLQAIVDFKNIAKEKTRLKNILVLPRMRFSRAGNIPTIFLPFRFVCTFPLFCL